MVKWKSQGFGLWKHISQGHICLTQSDSLVSDLTLKRSRAMAGAHLNAGRAVPLAPGKAAFFPLISLYMILQQEM